MARRLQINTYDNLTKTLTKLLQELDTGDVTEKRRRDLRLMTEICKVQAQILRDTELMQAMNDYEAVVEQAKNMDDGYYL